MIDLRKHFASRQNDLVERLSELVSRVTVNPPGNEKVAADYVASLLSAWGVRYQTFEAEPGRTNLVAYVGDGSPKLLVACHLDTVGAGDGWETDPFNAVLRDGRIYGRGACDNKGSAAAMLSVVEHLSMAEPLEGQLLAAFVADEETGSNLGLNYLLGQDLIQADFGIIPDAASRMRNVFVAEKGAVFFEITSFGKQAHGSTPQLGVNAAWNLVELLSRFKSLELPGARHPLLSPPTMNLGVLSGGVAPNVVPAVCRAKIDVRFLPGSTIHGMLDLIQATMRRVESDLPGSRFELNVLTAEEPIEVNPVHPLVVAVQEETERLLGFRPQPAGIGGGTVAKSCVEKGIPAVNFAPGDGDVAHTAKEYMDVSELVDFAAVMTAIVRRLLGKGGS